MSLVKVTFLLLCWDVGINSQPEFCSPEGLVRLGNTSSFDGDFSGRVEVCYSGVWGTVGNGGSGTSLWSEKSAQVACRRAGFDGAINSIYTNGLTFSDRASDRTPVHFTVTSCTGSELSLINCTIDTNVAAFMMSPTTYNHFLDAFVVCRPKTESYSRVHPAGTQAGDFRLSGDSRNGRGAVEIYTRQFLWVSICPDGFSDSDAAALCSRLGYAGGTKKLYNIPAGSVGPLLLYDTDCTETGLDVGLGTTRITAGVCSFEVSLGGCPSGSTQYAGVECFSSPVSQGAVRLYGGGSTNGVLETNYDGKWGLVCRESFGENEARAVCSELGYHPPKSEWSNAGSTLLAAESNLKPVWLSGVRCSEDVSRLSDCSQFSQIIGYGECDQLVAVTCEPRFSSGEIAGMVIGIPAGVIVIFIIAWFAGLNEHWKNRRNNRHYRAIASCCSACKERCQPIHVQPEQNAQNETSPTNNPRPSQPPPISVPSTSSAAEPEPTEQELTKTAPPQYSTAIGFQQIAADLPPPYTEAAAPPPH